MMSVTIEFEDGSDEVVLKVNPLQRKDGRQTPLLPA